MSPVSRYLLMAGGDERVVLWDLPSGALLSDLSARQLFEAAGLPAGSGWKLHFVRFDAAGRQALLGATRITHGGLRTPAPEPAAAAGACLLRLDLDGGEVQALPLAQDEPALAFALEPGRQRVLVARPDHRIEWWDMAEERRLSVLAGHAEQVNAVAFRSDGETVLSCSRDRTLRLWQLAGGRCLAAFTADAALRSLALSPAGDVAAVGDVAGRVHLLRLPDGMPPG